MKKLIILILLLTNITAFAQYDRWVETNTGIGASGDFQVATPILITQDNNMYALIRNHKDGDSKNGIYRYNSGTTSWNLVINFEHPTSPSFAFGVKAFFTDGTKIFGMQDQQEIFELDLSVPEWKTVAEMPDFGQETNRIEAWEGKIYMSANVPSANAYDNDWVNRKDENGVANFSRGENFVMVYDIENQTTDLLRNPNNPIDVPSGGWKIAMPLANGDIYYCSSTDYADSPEYQGGIYKWNGTDWVDVSAGLNAINITGNGPGQIWPLRTDPQRTRLFVSTQQGYYEREDQEGGEGWYKYFYRESIRAFVSPSFLYVYQLNGSFKKIDRAVTTAYPGTDRPTCGVTVGSTSNGTFVTPDDGVTMFAAFEYRQDQGDACVEANEGPQGIYRYSPDPDREGVVRNLHIENGTYLGGEGESKVAETVINSSGNIIVAGKLATNMDLSPTVVASIPNIDENSQGRIYIMDDTWGKTIEQVIIVGNDIKDMDINNNDEIAIVTDDGILVLNSDYTLKWFNAEDTEGKRRVGIANDGEVVASLNTESNGAGVVKLYASDGTEMHKNTVVDDNGKHLEDVEISSEHGAYYMIGFTQKTSNLQVAYLYAYELTNTTTRKWTTWDFSVGGTPDLQPSDNGADTRGIKIKADDNGDVYMVGETAGGGPGGFSIFAYNGKDLSTKIAASGNDFYTDGTNSCGPCHITFVGKIDANNGTVKQGRFLHVRNQSNGKTNTLVTSEIEVDEDDYIYLSGKAAYLLQDRDVFNVNGNLTEPYRGNDQFVMMMNPGMNRRMLWGVFHKSGRTGGVGSHMAVRDGKVSYAQNSNSGLLITTDDALRPLPYNQVEGADSLSKNTVFLATWGRDVWKTANNDEMEYPFIPADSCFRADGLPCVTVSDGEDIVDLIRPFNLISPNGDNRNDVWAIENLGLAENYAIRVFTKNGQIVYETSNYNQDWGGRDKNGNPLPAGIYYYSIVVSGAKKPKTGYITIVY